MAPKKVRCKWYNDVGWPRFNPIKIKKGYPDKTGCTRSSDVCWYAHPDHPDWISASLAPFPSPDEYPDGYLPRTPTPSPLRSPLRKKRRWSQSPGRSRSPMRPEKRIFVKEEPKSPVLHYGSLSRDRSEPGELEESSSSVSLVKRIGRRTSSSPHSRGRGSSPPKYSRKNRAYSRERDYRDKHRRSPSYSRELERRKAKDAKPYDMDYNGGDRLEFSFARFERERERDRERSSHDSSRNASSFKSFSLPGREREREKGDADFNTKPLIDRLFEREPPIAPALPARPASAPKTSDKTAAEVDSVLASVLASVPSGSTSTHTPLVPGALQALALKTGFGAPGTAAQTQPPSDLSHSHRPTPPTDPPPLDPPPPPSVNILNSSNSRTMSTSTLMARSSMPPPPTPSTASTATATAPIVTPAPAAFQYSLPPKPSSLDASGMGENAKEELSREERAELWDKRIELLSEAIAAKRLLNDRLSDLKQRQTFASPERIANVASNAQEQIAVSVQSAQAEVEQAHERVKNANQKVLELDFWPVRRKPEAYDPAKKEQIQREEEEREGEQKLVEDEHMEMNERMNELGDAMSKMDKQMKEVALLLSSRTRSGAGTGLVGVSASTSAPAGSGAMDWEPLDGPRGLKRRKTGEDGPYASDSGSATLAPFSPISTPRESVIPRDEFRQFTHRLSKLESEFHELENLFQQDEESYREELEQTVEMHVEQMREELVSGVRAKREEKVKRMKEDLAQIDKEVRDLVTEVAELFESMASVRSAQARAEEERVRVEAERAQLRTAMDEIASHTMAMQAQLAANIEETQSLRNQLTLAAQSAQSTSPTSPSPPYSSLPASHTPSIADLTSALLPRIIEAVRSDLEPRLLEQRADIIKLIREAAPWHEVDAMRKMVERVVQLPEVLSVLQSSGVLNGSGGLNLNGSGVGMDVERVGVESLSPGVPAGAVQVNGTGTGTGHLSKSPL